jgi:hypothetical protein
MRPNRQENVSVHAAGFAWHEPSGHSTFVPEHVFSLAQFSARPTHRPSRHWYGVDAEHARVGSGGQFAGFTAQLLPSGQMKLNGGHTFVVGQSDSDCLHTPAPQSTSPWYAQKLSCVPSGHDEELPAEVSAQKPTFADTWQKEVVFVQIAPVFGQKESEETQPVLAVRPGHTTPLHAT